MEAKTSQVISICGPSAAGKKTFVAEALRNPILRDQFNLRGTIEAYGSDFLPLEEIPRSSADVILIKWQFAYNSIVQGLRYLYPKKIHRAIWICRPIHQHARDLAIKYPARAREIEPLDDLKFAWQLLDNIWFMNWAWWNPIFPELVGDDYRPISIEMFHKIIWGETRKTGLSDYDRERRH